MAEAPLYMVRVELDSARLFEFARRRRLPIRHVDVGYVVHCAMRGLYGDRAPQPFYWKDNRRSITVLGYGDSCAADLLEHARAFAEPFLWSLHLPESVLDKRMPSMFPRGLRLSFDVRLCPVLRKSKDGEKHRAGAEVDVFLSRCWQAGSDEVVDRETVYREWLAVRLAANRGARLIEANLRAFCRERVVRSTHGEGARVRWCERPDARFAGTLAVDDPDAFRLLLRRGLGRHRAFGFGMLLLRPMRLNPC